MAVRPKKAAFKPPATSDTVIDVSHWQGKTIDWVKVKSAGKLVAMIKAAEGTSTDDTWHINAPNARAAGVLVIPYLFMSSEAAEHQVSYFAAVAGLQPGMPVAIDWEGNGAPPAAVVEAVGLGIKKIINRDPLGYWGQQPPGNPTTAMGSWPRWIPRYGINNGKVDPTHPVTDPWLFWQYTSNAVVSGIGGTADASLFAGTDAELIAWHTTGTLSQAGV
jgi:lysozyme